MPWWDYVETISRNAPQRAVATAAGVDSSTVSRWKLGLAPRPANVVAFARAYDRPILEAFVAAEFLTAEEAGAPLGIDPADSLRELDDLALLDELRARAAQRSEVANPPLARLAPLSAEEPEGDSDGDVEPTLYLAADSRDPRREQPQHLDEEGSQDPGDDWSGA